MARLLNPPKDSLYAISSQLYATKIREGLDQRLFDPFFSQGIREFTEQTVHYIDTGYGPAVRHRRMPGFLADILFFYLYYCSHRAYRYCSDIALSEHLATQLYLSGTEGVPYNEFQTDSVFTNVNLQSADLVIQEENRHTKVVSCVLINLDRLENSSELNPLADVITRGLFSSMVSKDAETKALFPKYMYVIIGQGTGLESKNTRIIGLSSIYQGINGELVLGDLESKRGSTLAFKRVQDALYDAQNSESPLYSYIGIALDMALKAVILNRLGDFRGESRNFTTPYSRSLDSKKKPTRSKKGKRGKPSPRRSSPYAVTYMQSSDVPWIPPEEVADALEREIDELNAELQRVSPNTRNHYKMIWVVEKYIRQHQIPQSDIYAEDESRPRRNKYGDLVFKKRYLIKRLYTFDSSSDEVLDTPNIHVKRLSSRTNPYNAVNELTFGCELDPYEVREFMEEHYPYSVSSPNKFLEDHPEPPYKYYHSADFTWIGSKGRMLRLQPSMEDRIHPVEGNIFYDEKLCAIADAPSVYDFKIPFMCGYCEVYTMDCDSVLSAMSHNDYEYYEPDADDVGEVHIQLRDGNHRTIGALASGNDAYVFISDNQYQSYQDWISRGRPRNAAYEWLDDNLI